MNSSVLTGPRKIVRKLQYRVLSRRRLEFFRELQDQQWDGLEDVTVRHDERLLSLLSHSAAHVPYYRDMFRTLALDGITRGDISTFRKIPLLEKEDLRDQFDQLKSEDVGQREIRLNSSGGTTTGEPIRFVQDRTYLEWSRAVGFMANDWCGYDECSPRALLWGSERDLLVGQETFQFRLSQWLQNEVLLNAYRMSPSDMRRYVDCINTARPNLIVAYVEAIYELAQFVERENLTIEPPGAIMTSAGTLYQPMREVIERVFGTAVFNRYGSREFGVMASECDRHEGLHVFPDAHHIEILRPDGCLTAPGEIGELVVTSLTNYAMPLIRFRTGDLAAWAEEPCSCGRQWPLLKEVAGRTTDMFLRRDGSKVVPEFFIQQMTNAFDGKIHKFQIVQETYDRIRVRVVTPFTLDQMSDELSVLRARIRRAMGPKCELVFDVTDEIRPTASGKHRFVLSEIAQGSRLRGTSH